jgi:hypothetical protein
LLAGTAGCTHLTELSSILPTAAIQAFAGDVWSTRDSATDTPAGVSGHEGAHREPPFQLDRCHALRFDGEAVRRFYPRWHGHVPRSVAAGHASAAAATVPAGAAQPGMAGSRPASGPNHDHDHEVQSNSQTEGNHA